MKTTLDERRFIFQDGSVKIFKEQFKDGKMKAELKFSLDLQMNFALNIPTKKISKFGTRQNQDHVDFVRQKQIEKIFQNDRRIKAIVLGLGLDNQLLSTNFTFFLTRFQIDLHYMT